MDLIPWRRKAAESPVTPETGQAEFRHELEDLFERFWGRPFGLDWPFEGHSETRGFAAAALDISETDDEVRIKADMPGVDPKEIQIDVEGDRLTVRAQRKEEQEENEKNFVRTERRCAGFHRSVALPSSMDSTKAEAEYKDGVLTIRLPRREGAKPRRISVKS